MPCFKGLAVSIHTPDGPLPEFSIQKQSRQSRIACYIPVPPPKPNPETQRPEQSSFAISVTLLTPGAAVPYSRPLPTPEDPFPRQKIVGGLPGSSFSRGAYEPSIGPYIPLTPSPNETVAAYIHFDGRAKEEVATLLRRGVETWVNSRWVSVPDSEGGGLAEREFLFREVGLERWLNGLDLEGEDKDVAARIERRKQRLEKRRRKRMEAKANISDDEDDDPITGRRKLPGKQEVLRYGHDKHSPIEGLSGDEGMFSSDSDSDDDVPMPEAAGQIKVSLYRVLASGEIKRGEYSPQFDAHDDDEAAQEQSGDGDADVDHTTTFAKPKTLDPKSISTQTVTGIDPPDKPYATFTFFYRGEKQLKKMGIHSAPEQPEEKPITTKRKSRQIDFSSLPPLKAKGTVGYAGYRDPSGASNPAVNGSKDPDDMDSDEDENVTKKPNGAHRENEDAMEDEKDTKALSAEEIKRRAELAEGVKKIQLKRQHSFDLSGSANTRKQPAHDESNDTIIKTPNLSTTTTLETSATPINSPIQTSATATPRLPDINNFGDTIGSPFKRHRPSLAGSDFKGFVPPEAGPAGKTGDVGLGIQQAPAPITSTSAPADTATAFPVKSPEVQVKQEQDVPVKQEQAMDEEL